MLFSAGSTKSAAQEASEAQTPRTSDGHPDLSGVYFPGAEDPDTFQVKGRVNTKFSGPEEKPSYQPWVVEKIKLIGNDPGLMVRIVLPLRGPLDEAQRGPGRRPSTAKDAVGNPNPSSSA